MAYKCSVCGEPGHNINTCPKKAERKVVPTRAARPKVAKAAASAVRVERAPAGAQEIVLRLRVIVSVEHA